MATRIPLIYTGTEINDLIRAASRLWTTTTSGGMTDGLLNDSSTAVRRAATNLFRRGQCDALTDTGVANAGSGLVQSLDATTPPPFSTQSFKGVSDGTAANVGNQHQSATGQAAAAGTIGVGSAWFKGVAGQSYACSLRWGNTDATTTIGTVTTFVATGAWQLVTPAPLAVAVGKTGDALKIAVYINGTRAETLWTAHPMLEKGVAVVSPYVASSGGTTATHASGHMRVLASPLVQATGIWVAARVRVGWSAAARTADFPQLWSWEKIGDSTSRLSLIWNGPSARWAMDRRIAATPVDAQIVSAHQAGDVVTIIGYYDGANVGLSVNGSAFVKVADARAFVPDDTLLHIGSSAAGGSQIDSDIFWLLTGTGTLSDADARYLASLADPSLVSSGLPGSAGATAYWDGSATSMVSLVPTPNLSSGGPSGPVLGVELDLSGHGPTGTPTWTDVSTRVKNGSISIQRGRPNFLDRIEVGSAQVQLDNSDRAFEPEYGASPYYPNILPRAGLRVSVTFGSTVYRLHRGFVDGWPITWPAVKRSYAPVTSNDAFSYLAGARVTPQVFASGLSGTQIATFLNQASWPSGLRLLDPGAETLLGVDATVNYSDPPDVLSLVQDSADSEAGIFFIAGDGTATFHDRDHRVSAARSTTVQATFSDDPTTGLPYLLPSPDFGIDRVWNDVRVTSGIGGALPQVLADTTSIGRYGRRTLARSTRLSTDAAAADQALRILNDSKDPHLRFPTITLDPTRYPALWPVVLGLEISDRVTVLRTPYLGGATIAKTCFVEAIRHDIQYASDRVTWTTTLSLSLADPGAYMTLDSASRGVLDLNILR